MKSRNKSLGPVSLWRKDNERDRRKRLGIKGVLSFILVLSLFGLGACNFDVVDPTRLTDEDIEGDAMMSALVVGAITSYDGAYDRLVMISGLLSDELIASGSWNGWHQADKQGDFNLFYSDTDHINIPWIS